MSFYKIKEVAEIAVNRALDETEEVVDAARKFYCNLHQNHPAWTVGRTFSNSSLILRAIDRMCDDGSGNYVPPPVPTPPFTGGQCCDKTYDVSFTLNLYKCNGGQYVQGFPFDVTVTGKIIGYYVDGTPEQFTRTKAGLLYEQCDGTQVKLQVWDVPDPYFASSDCSEPNPPFFGNFVAGQLTQFSIDSLTTNDGSPDDCGDPPAEYPPEPPPADEDLTDTIDVTNIENNTYSYDVTVNRDTNNTINFPPSITVNNIAVSMDVTGITVGDTTNINIESGGNDSGVFPPLPVPVEDENVGKELITEPGAVEETVANLYAVIVNFTAIPFNAKISSGADAPRIIYGGWVEFKIGSNYLPREYIDFDNSVFLAPKGATGYAVTIKLGYNATITKQFYRETTDAS